MGNDLRGLRARRVRPRRAALLVTWGLACACACASQRVAPSSRGAASQPTAPSSSGATAAPGEEGGALGDVALGPALAAPDLPECGTQLAGRVSPELVRHALASGEGPIRAAAQRGLAFLGRDTLAWQSQHNCYGCHVQAVTFDAMIVGRENGYAVPDAHFDGVLEGLTTLPGGAKQPGIGFSVRGSPGHLEESSKTFGGAALAAYDQHVGGDLADDLLRTAEQILPYQLPDGSVRSTDRRPPVVAGLMQSTHQAAATWRQAYARSADDRWLQPLARAEQYIRSRAAALTDARATYLQDLSYAVLGLRAAGADAGEPLVTQLADALRGRQNSDGGWGFRPGEASDAFATGQAVNVLKGLGASHTEGPAARGMAWLLGHQREDGGWSTGGDRRGEAMWGVLGLVTADVLDVRVAGLVDGQRLSSPADLTLGATEPTGGLAARIELRVDDVPVARACGEGLRARVDPRGLASGAHRVDVVATRRDGRESRRRLTFYTGDTFLTRAGARFVSGRTEISFRNVAAAAGGVVRLRVHREGEPDAPLRVLEAPAVPGAMVVAWDGQDAEGAPSGRGRFTGELAYVDAAGRLRQTLEVTFVHDTAEAQDARFGQVAGQLRLGDEDNVEGVEVELVDREGRVVQRTRSTRSGNYRFRNVDGGNYRVRTRRRSGSGVVEASAQAAPAQATSADLDL
ncbi:MAG: prenyltransferase/squalene oxidase repeat-containing protein [Myxococcota bacterium]